MLESESFSSTSADFKLIKKGLCYPPPPFPNECGKSKPRRSLLPLPSLRKRGFSFSLRIRKLLFSVRPYADNAYASV